MLEICPNCQQLVEENQICPHCGYVLEHLNTKSTTLTDAQGNSSSAVSNYVGLISLFGVVIFVIGVSSFIPFCMIVGATLFVFGVVYGNHVWNKTVEEKQRVEDLRKQREVEDGLIQFQKRMDQTRFEAEQKQKGR